MADAKYTERRQRVMIGGLPDDFLRVSSANPASESQMRGPARAAVPFHYGHSNAVGSISVSIIQAQLVKNYGLTKMDPYVRLRIGHNVYETHADNRSGKYPNWNKTFHSYLNLGVKSIYMEVYAEHAITPDERVAWADYTLPDEFFHGKFVDTWVPLTGSHGDGKEGSINITVSFTPASAQPQPVTPTTMVMMPAPMVGVPYYVPGIQAVQYPMVQQPMLAQPGFHPMQYQQPAPYRPTEEDIKQLQEMFPSFDKEVILGVLENSRGKDTAINALLALSSDK